MDLILRLTLRLLPPGFRKEFGDEIRELLVTRARVIRSRQGWVGLLRFWGLQFSDIAYTAFFERQPAAYKQNINESKPGIFNMETLLQEIGHAFRSLRRDPVFAGVAIMTLALGIGANSTVFNVVNGVVLKPLPYTDSDRLVTVWSELPGFGFDSFPSVSDAQFLHYGERNRTLEVMGGWRGIPARLSGDGNPERIESADVSTNLFGVLGISPQMGRGFTEEEGQPGGPDVAILGHELWTRTFGADQGIIGQTVTFNDIPTEIVGVMPEGFRFYDPDMEMFRPLRIDRDNLVGTSFGIGIIGKLKDGISVDDATAEFAGLVGSLPETDPTGFFSASTIEQAQLKPKLHLMMDDVVGTIGSALWLLLGTVGVVMLIACANVANLFLVRAEGRQREIAVRVALGSNRGGIARLFLAESIVLGLIAGVVGLGIAFAATRALVAFGPEQLPRLEDIKVDGFVIAFTAAISLLSGVLFGGFPALRHSNPPLGSTLQQEGRSGMISRERQRIRGALVITQVALALLLLTGSGLMVRSLVSLKNVDPGFDPKNVLTFQLTPPPTAYPDAASVASYYSRLLDELSGLPGIQSVGANTRAPLFVGSGTPVQPEGFEVEPGEIPPVIPNAFTTPGFFRTNGIPILAGRTFRPSDQADPESTPTAVVSEGFVERFWPGENGVGKRFRAGIEDGNEDDSPWISVVGVVGDVRGRGLTQDPVDQIYFPFAGNNRAMTITVATINDPISLAATLRSAVWQVDPNIPVTDVQTMQKIVDDSMASTLFTMTLLAIAAAVALVLGSVGIYGVIAYVVNQRTREIGVRMALGAKQWDVSRMVLQQGGTVAGIGVVLGLVAAFGLTRLMESLLFGVTAVDPPTFATAAVVIALVSLLASYMPARRAARVDPVEALRGE